MCSASVYLCPCIPQASLNPDVAASILTATAAAAVVWVCCSKLDWNRQNFQEPSATGIKGTIPAAWMGMTELQTL